MKILSVKICQAPVK